MQTDVQTALLCELLPTTTRSPYASSNVFDDVFCIIQAISSCKMGLVSQLAESAKANPFSCPVRTAKCGSVPIDEGKFYILHGDLYQLCEINSSLAFPFRLDYRFIQ
ncbi:hypothetical protein Y032_0471g2043 [Ancylostoma ceylanicum]|uniref:Uncharacterized protein n=1 Tax=Ancylostoma ceylanicum TaxID=53326 RepID=A0A016WWE0_9BILA|nr:hypothetical protein Y032_0471g2043 [Ancylostoma ceylanicum]